DADLNYAIENVGDGAFFNSGQCCCGIERVYVHEAIFNRFVEGLAELGGGYRLADPTVPGTNLRPMARLRTAALVREQLVGCVAKGPGALVDPARFPQDTHGSCFVAPQVLVDVDHAMPLMRDENFGPVAGVMKVSSDEEAVRLMNDSPYGLTASVWTSDVEAAE